MTGMEEARRNLDERVVDGFGDEWERFSNQELDQAELEAMFDDYTSIFPWEKVDQSSVGLVAGCGSGRWARFFILLFWSLLQRLVLTLILIRTRRSRDHYHLWH